MHPWGGAACPFPWISRDQSCSLREMRAADGQSVRAAGRGAAVRRPGAGRRRRNRSCRGPARRQAGVGSSEDMKPTEPAPSRSPHGAVPSCHVSTTTPMPLRASRPGTATVRIYLAEQLIGAANPETGDVLSSIASSTGSSARGGRARSLRGSAWSSAIRRPVALMFAVMPLSHALRSGSLPHRYRTGSFAPYRANRRLPPERNGSLDQVPALLQ